MKDNKLTPKERKKLARLKREIVELDSIACKHDLDEDFAVSGEKLNSRYFNKLNELNFIKAKTK